MRTKITIIFLGVVLAILFAGPSIALSEVEGGENRPAPLILIRIEGPINPGSAGYLSSSIEKASE